MFFFLFSFHSNIFRYLFCVGFPLIQFFRSDISIKLFFLYFSLINKTPRNNRNWMLRNRLVQGNHPTQNNTENNWKLWKKITHKQEISTKQNEIKKCCTFTKQQRPMEKLEWNLFALVTFYLYSEENRAWCGGATDVDDVMAELLVLPDIESFQVLSFSELKIVENLLQNFTFYILHYCIEHWVCKNWKYPT